MTVAALKTHERQRQFRLAEFTAGTVEQRGIGNVRQRDGNSEFEVQQELVLQVREAAMGLQAELKSGD